MRLDEANWLAAAPPQTVLGMLTDAEHTAYVVGGCVRDHVLGRPIGDVDVATDAPPEAMLALAEAAGIRAVPTGIDHGTVTLVVDGQGIEATTFRRDVATDGRRAVVAFAEDVAEDARRRDFTLNALYADRSGRIVDPLGGWDDLVARRLRFIGDAGRRIDEDVLRILRFFRFRAWYAADAADADAMAAIAARTGLISDLPGERIGGEMRRLLAAPDPAPAVADMDRAGALVAVLPGATATALPRLVAAEAVLGLASDPMRRLAALGGDAAAERLRLSKADARRFHRLADAADGTDAPGAIGYHLGRDHALSVLALRGTTDADAVAAVRRGAAATFPVAARDLPDRLQGPEIGTALRRLTDAWIDSGFVLSREDLLARLD